MHRDETGSELADRILVDWVSCIGAIRRGDAQGLPAGARGHRAGRGRRPLGGRGGHGGGPWVTSPGFLKYRRQLPQRRPVPVRLRDWREVYEPFPVESAQEQGARCMDCGIPFCHEGCPLGNLIPEWNDLVFRDDWSEASERLHATNNFPEFTGRLCPAPCEGACVLGINDDPVTIERIEYEIAERAWAEGWVEPTAPAVPTGKTCGGGRIGTGGAGRGPAAGPGRPSGGGVRTGGEARGAPPLRHPRVQDGEGGARPEARPDVGRGGRVPLPCLGGGERTSGDPGSGPRRPDDRRPLVGRRVRQRGAGQRGHPPPGHGRPRSRAGGDPSGHGLPEAVQHGPRGPAGRHRRSRRRASTW